MRVKLYGGLARKSHHFVTGSGDSMSGAECTAMSLAVAFEARQATATDDDVEEISEPIECPQPRHPDMPRQGCICQPDGTCVLPWPE